MSGGPASSAQDNASATDEKVVTDDFDGLVFYENGVAKGACRNSLLCGEWATLSAQLERRLCWSCFKNYHRAFIFCTMKTECNVCLEEGKIGLMYTCNGNHKVCTDCFKETRTNKAAFEKLKRCFLCKVGTILGDLYDGVDPMA
jgi:hypothetical protein